LLQAELASPDDLQFGPEFATIIKAARKQLGLELKPATRKLKVVVVGSAKCNAAGLKNGWRLNAYFGSYKGALKQRTPKRPNLGVH
jgi:hypothetical protein